MEKIRLIAITALLSLCAWQANAQRVIGFYAGWENSAWSVQYDLMTDVNYAFGEPTMSGGLKSWSSFERTLFDQFMQASAASGVRRHISIGGADGTGAGQNYAQIFSTIAASSSLRTTFANNVANFVGNEGLDGVDIDWEWPGKTANVNTDGANFVLLMQAIRSALDTKGNQTGKYYELSADVFPSLWNNGGILTGMYQYVDHLNIMCYDFDNQTHHSSYAEAVNSIDYWSTTKGLSKSKMVLGLAFYGRAAGPNQLGSQSPYKNIAASNPASASQTDITSGWYYNGQPTIRNKVELAVNEGLKGVMIWEVSQDRTDQYSLLKAIDDQIQAGCSQNNFASNTVSICGYNSVTLDSQTDAASNSYVWKRNGQTIGGATSSSYSATQGGLYELLKTQNSNGCVASSLVTVIDAFDEIDMGGTVAVCGTSTVTLDAMLDDGSISYSWSPGGMSTKTVDVSNTGTYTVTVSDNTNQCPDQVGTVEVSSAGLATTGATTCAGVETTLAVESAGGPFSWFDAMSGGNLVDIGNSIDVTVNNTTTYYVQNAGGSITEQVGWVHDVTGCESWQGPGCAAGDYAGELRLVFDVFQPMTIDSVTLHYDGDWGGPNDVITFTLYDASMNVVKTAQTTVNANGKIRVPVGIDIDVAATNYALGFSSTPANTGAWSSNLWSEKRGWGDNFAYPFTFDGICSFKHTVAASESNFGLALENWYAGFYEMAISTGEPCDRVPVVATVKACTAPTISITNPTNNSAHDQNVTITMTADASDAEGDVVSVVYTVSEGGSTIATINGNGTFTGWNADWTPINEGTYVISAVATDEDGQTTTSSSVTVVVQVVGVEDEMEAGLISIFPNPFTETLTVQREVARPFTLNVIDAAGVVVESTNYGSVDHVEFGANLDAGLYTIQLVDAEGAAKATVVKK